MRPLALFLALLSIRPMPAQVTTCPYYMTPTPSVLLNDGSNSLRLEVYAGPTATDVRWQIPAQSPLSVQGSAPCQAQGPEFVLKDDGTQGDRVAGDKIFTIDMVRYRRPGEGICTGQQFRDQNAMDGFQNVRIGTLTLTTPTGPITLDSTFNFTTFFLLDANAYQSLEQVTPVSSTRQQTGWVMNVRDDNLSLEKGMGNVPAGSVSLTTAIPLLSSFLPDNYDFRVLVSTNETLCSSRTTGLHLSVRSSATGIGASPFDRSATYQAGPRLQGVTMIAYQGITSTAVFYHETNHQWGASLSSIGLSDSGAHWLQNTSVGGSLGSCSWTDNGDGTFTSLGAPRPTRDNADLELYLSGFIPSSDVQPVYIASNTNQNFCVARTKILGPFRKVTIDDIVGQYGPRIPAPATSQREFKMATVIVSANRLLNPLEMTFYSRMAQVFEGATVETASDPPLAWPQFTRNTSTLNLKLDSFGGPFLRAIGVVHGASAVGGRVAAGEVIVIYGSGLGPATLAGLQLDANGLVAKQVAGTRVLFDGVAAPIIYSSAGQLSVVVPYSIAGKSFVSVQVEYQGVLSDVIALPVAAANPGIFTQNLSGKGPGAILNQDYQLNTSANPAAKGSVIQVYGTGEGQTTPPGVDGLVNASMFPHTTAMVTATIDGVNADVKYAGAAPQALSGLLQVNVVVPVGVRSGEAPIQIKIGAASSSAGVTVFVQ